MLKKVNILEWGKTSGLTSNNERVVTFAAFFCRPQKGDVCLVREVIKKPNNATQNLELIAVLCRKAESRYVDLVSRNAIEVESKTLGFKAGKLAILSKIFDSITKNRFINEKLRTAIISRRKATTKKDLRISESVSDQVENKHFQKSGVWISDIKGDARQKAKKTIYL